MQMRVLLLPASLSPFLSTCTTLTHLRAMYQPFTA